MTASTFPTRHYHLCTKLTYALVPFLLISFTPLLVNSNNADELSRNPVEPDQGSTTTAIPFPRQDDDDETEKPTIIRRFANLIVGSVGVLTETVSGINSVVNDTHGQGSVPEFFFNGVVSGVKPIAMRPTRPAYTPRPLWPGIRRTTAGPPDDPYSLLGLVGTDDEVVPSNNNAAVDEKPSLPAKPAQSFPSITKQTFGPYNPESDSDTDDVAEVTEKWQTEWESLGSVSGSEPEPDSSSHEASNKFEPIATNYFEGAGTNGGGEVPFTPHHSQPFSQKILSQTFEETPTTSRPAPPSMFHLKLLQSLIAKPSSVSNNVEKEKHSSIYEDLGIKEGSPIIVNGKVYPDLETYIKDKPSRL